MQGSRPPWFRTARMIGGAPWVPFEVARDLQDQLDAHRQRLQRVEAELEEARRVMQRLATQAQRQHGDPRDIEQLRTAYGERLGAVQAELKKAEERLAAAAEQAERSREEAEVARQQAREAAERMADRKPVPSDDDARARRLREDLERVRARTEQEVAAACQGERTHSLLRLASVHDDLRRGLEALPQDPTSPWYQGYRAILLQLEDQLAQAGATRFGALGEPFDPERHEAVGTVASAPEQVDHIVGMVQPGFALADGSLIRPAQVVVGR